MDFYDKLDKLAKWNVHSGLHELIIYPIDPKYLTIYSAYHNTYAQESSPYALNSSQNMNKKWKKNIPSPALLLTIACCLMAVIFLE